MPSELITYAGLAVPLGYAGKKLLDPTLEAVGENLRFYAARLTPIFRRLDEIVDEHQITPLTPPFAMELLKKASLADEDDVLTEMWAQLIANAAEEQSSYHLVFSEILSQLGAQEAKLLESIEIRPNRSRDELFQAAYEEFRDHFVNVVWWSTYDDDLSEKMASELLSMDHTFPGFKKAVETMPTIESIYVPRRVNVADPMVLDVLERQKVLEEYRMHHPSYAEDGTAPVVTFSILTQLGFEFLRTVRGKK